MIEMSPHEIPCSGLRLFATPVGMQVFLPPPNCPGFVQTVRSSSHQPRARSEQLSRVRLFRAEQDGATKILGARTIVICRSSLPASGDADRRGSHAQESLLYYRGVAG